MDQVAEKDSNKLKIQFKMEPGRRLQLNSLIQGLKGFRDLLNATERGLTNRRTRVKWIVIGMGIKNDAYFVEILPVKKNAKT